MCYLERMARQTSYICQVKSKVSYFLITTVLVLLSLAASAQCSICTKTAQQLGEKPALGLNNGILYLAAIPFAVMGYIGYRWWKAEKLRQ